MNQFQRLWWLQAQSDHKIYVLLREHGAAQCHQLHYLQMATEKLGKAYFWRNGNPPLRSHAGFVQFMRQLGAVPAPERAAVMSAFSFSRFSDFQRWVSTVLPLAYELQRLAPALANDGPNPEYPWPQNAPTNTPATHMFPLASSLRDTGQGRNFIRLLKIVVDNFPTLP